MTSIVAQLKTRTESCGLLTAAVQLRRPKPIVFGQETFSLLFSLRRLAKSALFKLVADIVKILGVAVSEHVVTGGKSPMPITPTGAYI